LENNEMLFGKSLFFSIDSDTRHYLEGSNYFR